jgi:aryl-alcohol dehydrogenase-like predicted oxidoreductase
MNYNYFKGTRLEVSQLSLGTMMFGGQTNENESLLIMQYAYENGINFFDTANNYNDGKSECIVGKFLKGKRDKVLLATKVRYKTCNNDSYNEMGLGRRNILNSVDASLRRLETDYVDILYMHAPDYETSLGETLETMSELVKSGKARYIGVSNFAAWQIADMLSICEKHDYVSPIITQNVYNLLNRGIETELVPFLKTHNLNLTVYNPIAAGLLSGKYSPGILIKNTRFALNKSYANRYWTDKNFQAVDKFTKLAEIHGINILQLAYRWLMSQNVVVSIVSGVSNLTQHKQNIAIVDPPPPPLDNEILLQCNEIWLDLSGKIYPYVR